MYIQINNKSPGILLKARLNEYLCQLATRMCQTQWQGKPLAAYQSAN